MGQSWACSGGRAPAASSRLSGRRAWASKMLKVLCAHARIRKALRELSVKAGEGGRRGMADGNVHRQSGLWRLEGAQTSLKVGRKRSVRTWRGCHRIKAGESDVEGCLSFFLSFSLRFCIGCLHLSLSFSLGLSFAPALPGLPLTPFLLSHLGRPSVLAFAGLVSVSILLHPACQLQVRQEYL